MIPAVNVGLESRSRFVPRGWTSLNSGFDRLIRAGDSCEVVNAVAEFCFSMVTHLVSSTLAKISELSSVCKYTSVVSMIAAAQFTLLSYTPSCRVLAGR